MSTPTLHSPAYFGHETPRALRMPESSAYPPRNYFDASSTPRSLPPTAIEAGASPAFKVNMSAPTSSYPSSSAPSQAPHYAVLSFPPPNPETRANRYPCPSCSKLFDRPSSLRTHMNTHTGEMRESFSFGVAHTE